MNIWLYPHETKVGDYVYADGSTSDILNLSKTVVGICFLIQGKEKGQRFCFYPKSVGDYKWGLSLASWPEGITLQDNPDYPVFDIPTIVNSESGGVVGYLNESMYLDPSTSDGFAYFSPSYSIGQLGYETINDKAGKYNKGDRIPYGLARTLRIIDHRNIILQDGAIMQPLPVGTTELTPLQHLQTLMAKIVSENSGADKYNEFYYPAASMCQCFAPTVKEEEHLDEGFKAGNWWLPTVGEIARIYWYWSHGTDTSSDHALFADAINNGIIYIPYYNYFANCAEGGSTNIGSLNSLNGQFVNANKVGTYTVYPICTF